MHCIIFTASDQVHSADGSKAQQCGNSGEIFASCLHFICVSALTWQTFSEFQMQFLDHFLAMASLGCLNLPWHPSLIQYGI